MPVRLALPSGACPLLPTSACNRVGLRHHIDGNQACFHNEEGARPPVHFFRATQSIVAQQHIYTARWPTASLRASLLPFHRGGACRDHLQGHISTASLPPRRGAGFCRALACLLRYDSLPITAQHAYYWGTIALPIVTQRKARSQRHRKAQNDYHRAPLGPMPGSSICPGCALPLHMGGIKASQPVNCSIQRSSSNHVSQFSPMPDSTAYGNTTKAVTISPCRRACPCIQQPTPPPPPPHTPRG